MLEDALRDMFRRRVVATPGLADPATVAIRRARAVRRMRNTGGLVAAAVAGALFTGGLVYVQDWRVSREGAEFGLAGVITPAPPTTAAATAPAPSQPVAAVGVAARVDFFAADQLWTASGERLSAKDAGEVARIYRVPAGWLLGDGTATHLLRTDGTTIALPLVGQWVVSADGGRVAYPDGPTTIRVGKLDRDGVAVVASAAVTAGAVPVTFAGERLVMAVRAADGQTREVDHWPLARPYRPTWTTQAMDVYESPGTELVARVPHAANADACLVRLAAPVDGLRVAGPAACGLGLTSAATISPDGLWLAALVGQVVSFYDLATAFDRPMPSAVCGVPDLSRLVWEDDSALVAGNGVEAVRCRTDGTAEHVPLPPDLPDGWRLVPARLPRAGG